VTACDFAASKTENIASNKTENILDVSRGTDCSNNTDISNISDIIDSSLISYLNKESICTSLTISDTCESILNNDNQTLCNTSNELKKTCLNETGITIEESKKQSCDFQQLDKECFQQSTNITEQEEGLIKTIKKTQDNNILHSISKGMNNKKITVHSDCNNNSEGVAPKSKPIIIEDIIYNKSKYIISKLHIHIQTDQKDDGQKVFKSSEEKEYKLSNKKDDGGYRLSNKEDVSFSVISNYSKH